MAAHAPKTKFKPEQGKVYGLSQGAARPPVQPFEVPDGAPAEVKAAVTAMKNAWDAQPGPDQDGEVPPYVLEMRYNVPVVYKKLLADVRGHFHSVAANAGGLSTTVRADPNEWVERTELFHDERDEDDPYAATRERYNATADKVEIKMGWASGFPTAWVAYRYTGRIAGRLVIANKAWRGPKVKSLRAAVANDAVILEVDPDAVREAPKGCIWVEKHE